MATERGSDRMESLSVAEDEQIEWNQRVWQSQADWATREFKRKLTLLDFRRDYQLVSVGATKPEA